ncbi:MAG: ATP-binding protein [Candidatus Kariarchaeaceae archaeon]
MNIDRKILYVFMGISIFPLIVVSTALTSYTHYYGAEVINDQTINQLLSITSIQKSRLEEIYEFHMREVHLISHHSELSRNLQEYLDNSSSEKVETINELLTNFLETSSTYIVLHIHSVDGIVIAATDNSSIGEDHSTHGHYQKVTSTEIFFENEEGELREYFTAPITNIETIIGTITIKTDASNIKSVTSDYTGLHESGETVLAQKNANGDAIFITPLRFDSEAAMVRIVPKEDIDVPITQALLGNVEIFMHAKDYRNTAVIASTEYMNDTGWGIVVKIDKEEAMEPVINLTLIMIFGVLIASTAVIFVAFLFSRSITEPIKLLNTAAHEFGKGDFSVRAQKVYPDEVGELADTFNLMSNKIQEEIAKREVILSIVSHDLLNYFTVANGFLEIMKMEDHSEKTLDYISKVKSNTLQAVQLLKSLSVVLREDINEKKLTAIDLKSAVINAFNLLEDLYPGRMITKTISIAEEDKIKGDSLFNEVLTNLLTNAVKNHPTGDVKIEVIGVRKEGKYRLSIIDQGVGINPNERDEVFTRFNEYRKIGKGSGLGLFIVKNLMKMYNGKIWIESRVDSDYTKGTKMILEFPIV